MEWAGNEVDILEIVKKENPFGQTVPEGFLFWGVRLKVIIFLFYNGCLGRKWLIKCF